MGSITPFLGLPMKPTRPTREGGSVTGPIILGGWNRSDVAMAVVAHRIPFRKERVENAVLFFARKHTETAGSPLYQTFLYKYLAFIEFWSIKEVGTPAFGLTYRAMDEGPVPLELYDQNGEFRSSNLYSFNYEGDNRFTIDAASAAKPNMDYFSRDEASEMRALIKRFAHEFSRTKEPSEASHTEIRSWRVAVRNAIMRYEDELKSASESAREAFQIYRAFQRH